MRSNRRLIIRELAHECGISVGPCYDILTTGFSITTTLQSTQHSEFVSFWSNTRSLFFPLPTHFTLPSVTFSCSQNLKNLSTEEDLRRFRRLRQMRRRSWKPSQKKRTRTVSRNGNTVGISLCVGEKSTLKGTQTCNFQIKYIFMTSVNVFFEQTSYIFPYTSWTLEQAAHALCQTNPATVRRRRNQVNCYHRFDIWGEEVAGRSGKWTSFRSLSRDEFGIRNAEAHHPFAMCLQCAPTASFPLNSRESLSELFRFLRGCFDWARGFLPDYVRSIAYARCRDRETWNPFVHSSFTDRGPQ